MHISRIYKFQRRIQDFPLGGADPRGDAYLRCGHFLAKMYVKTKELGPVGGAREGAPAAPPGSANRFYAQLSIN